MKSIPIRALLLAMLWGAVPAQADPIGKGELARLVSDRTWKLKWAACMGGTAGCVAYWDFTRNGTVCARAIGAKPREKCADDGKWRIDGDHLCWELTWLGGGEGYKKVCVSLDKSGDHAYVATRVGGIGVKFFDLSLVD